MKRVRSGFTLIELLIVVAIIGILAAIAIPNFLNAQVRSKVARVKADLNSMGVAMESYQIDNESYPADFNDFTPWDTTRMADGYVPGTLYRTIAGWDVRNNVSWKTLWALSTPVDYISTVPGDGFLPEQPYSYDSHMGSMGTTYPSSWILMGIGPDQVIGDWLIKQTPNAYGLWYDTTTGTVSPGDIWRTVDGPRRYAIEM